MPPHVSLRAQQTPPSPIRKLAHLAADARSRGLEVLHLNIGQPDITTPKEYWEGLKLFSEPVLAYEQSQGSEKLVQAWSRYMNRTLGLSTAPEHFLITTGASEALIFAFMVCSDPGDEIVVFDPTYANYLGFAATAGVTLTPIQTHFEEMFRLPSLEVIEKSISKKTRAILLCTPNNPTGNVYSQAELEMILNICRERDLFFIVDETYREFVYGDRKPLSLFHIVKEDPHVIVVDSLSKRFSLCGARLGCLITTNREVWAMCLNLAQARLASPTMEQLAAAHMLDTIPDSVLNQTIKEYEGRRNLLCSELQKIPGVSVCPPDGAFYLLAKLPVKSSEEFARNLLSAFAYQGKTVFVAPGPGFFINGKKGEQLVRLAFVLKEAKLRESVDILRDAITQAPF